MPRSPAFHLQDPNSFESPVDFAAVGFAPKPWELKLMGKSRGRLRTEFHCFPLRDAGVAN